jgi:hypothetical protein
MNRRDFLQKQFELSVQAGTSQRYHQQCAGYWWVFDFCAKIITAIFAVVALSIAIASLLVENKSVDVAGVAVSLAAAIAAIVLNVVPFGSWEQTHRDLFRQWTDFREDVDSLERELEGEPSPDHLCSLSKLEARSHRICGQEITPDDRRVLSCYQAEKRSRQFAAA